MFVCISLIQGYDASDMEEEDVGPTFEDLAIDDSLSDLERVQKYVFSNIALQRLVHVKMIGGVANLVGFSEFMAHLLPLLDKIGKDEEFVVRQNVADQLVVLAEVRKTFTTMMTTFVQCMHVGYIIRFN